MADTKSVSGKLEFQVAGDEQVEQFLRDRLMQLEVQYTGFEVQALEEAVDPETTNAMTKLTAKNIASVEARIDAVKRALNQRPKKKDKPAGEVPAF